MDMGSLPPTMKHVHMDVFNGPGLALYPGVGSLKEQEALRNSKKQATHG